MRIKSKSVDMICEKISNENNSIDYFNNVIFDLEKLYIFKLESDNNSNYPETKYLDENEFKETEKARIVEKFSIDNWLDLLTLELEFIPIFKYVVDKNSQEEINFAEASAGQQSTALLTILLNEGGSPLIIDQPEDDIDNRAIEEIIKMIWNAKKKRQLIFTSHNANLVVNGDAELVIACDYRTHGSQAGGRIKKEGAIDTQQIRKEITSVMEGGEKAFILRKDKYGF